MLFPLQVLADVFDAPVYTLHLSESSCLGSAYRALHGITRTHTLTLTMSFSLIGGSLLGLVAEGGVSFCEAVRDGAEPQLVATPHPSAAQVHSAMNTHTYTTIYMQIG